MYFDTHAHLDSEDFDADRAKVIARAREAGVSDILAVGIDGPSSGRCVELARQRGIHAAVGIQPNYVSEVPLNAWDEIVTLAGQPGVVAIGETGLDCYWDRAPLATQQDYFARHLALSRRVDLPFIVHLRESEQEILAMLRDDFRRGPLRGVMHSYTGTAEGAAECVEMGMYISFAGMLTYKNADTVRQVAASVPTDRLLIETDAPYLSPEPVRKIRRNEPSHVVHTCGQLAELHRISLAEMAAITTANARRLFSRTAT